jgi:outer membrane lipoprotein SlyB
MNKFKTLTALTLSVVLAGCAANTREQVPGAGNIVIDTNGVDMVKYSQAVRECRYMADGSSNTAVGAGKSAVMAGLIGGGAALALGGNSSDMGKAAGASALAGAVGGGMKASSEKNMVMRNCLRSRGYRVLN